MLGNYQGQVHQQPAMEQRHQQIPDMQQQEQTHASLGPEDQGEGVWDKLQILKDRYLNDMNELYQMLTARSNQPMPAEQLQKLKHYKDVLHRMIPYLRVPKERVPKEFNDDKVKAFEVQIVNIMETFKRRRHPIPPAPEEPPPPAGPGAEHPDETDLQHEQPPPGEDEE